MHPEQCTNLNELPRWVLDETGTLILKFVGPEGQHIEAFICCRPSYCDRGHWQFGIMTGIPSLDAADAFPRYYMRLETAIQEANEWINWRLYKQRVETPRRLEYGDPLIAGRDLTFIPSGPFELERK